MTRETLFKPADIDRQALMLAYHMLGLPNQCFSTDVNIEERRKQVKQIFTNFGGVQKAEDFVRVAALFGHDITVIPGIVVGGFPLQFPMTFFEDTKSGTHTIFIQINDDLSTGDDFPLPFPLPFSSGAEQFLLCIFNVLAPANVKVVTITEGQL
jgi:hypothetical protein